MPKTFHNNFHTYTIARKQDPLNQETDHTHTHIHIHIRVQNKNGTKDFHP